MKAIEVISVPVTDQEKAKEFYTGKMGFSVIVEAPFGNNQKWVQLGMPGNEVSITLVNWFPKMPAGSMQGLVVKTENIAADVEALKGKGIEMGKIDQTPWGKFSSFSDPDGNGWILHEG